MIESGANIVKTELGRENAYYIDEVSLSLAELKILIDAVQAANFITDIKTAELVEKLHAFSGIRRSEIVRDNIIEQAVKEENQKGFDGRFGAGLPGSGDMQLLFENSGMSSLSTFVRAMIFEGYIAQVNENELKELTRIANNVAKNINQIAHRANVTNKVYKEDIEEIKELGDKLWRPLMFLQTKVAQLKH